MNSGGRDTLSTHSPPGTFHEAKQQEEALQDTIIQSSSARGIHNPWLTLGTGKSESFLEVSLHDRLEWDHKS